MGQAKGYHGADSAKYKMSGSEGAVTAMPYLKSVSLDRQINSTSQYANNRQIIKVSTDNGYTGNLGTTARDTELEKSLGMIMPLSGGTGVVSRTGGKGSTTNTRKPTTTGTRSSRCGCSMWS